MPPFDLSCVFEPKMIGVYDLTLAREDLNYASHPWSTRRTWAIVRRFDREGLAVRGDRPTVFLALRSSINLRQLKAVSILHPFAGPDGGRARNRVAPLECVRLAIQLVLVGCG